MEPRDAGVSRHRVVCILLLCDPRAFSGPPPALTPVQGRAEETPEPPALLGESYSGPGESYSRLGESYETSKVTAESLRGGCT